MLFPLLVISFSRLEPIDEPHPCWIRKSELKRTDRRSIERTKRNSRISRAGPLNWWSVKSIPAQQLPGGKLLICWKKKLFRFKEANRRMCGEILREISQWVQVGCSVLVCCNPELLPTRWRSIYEFARVRFFLVFCYWVRKSTRVGGATARKAMKGFSVIEKAEAAVVAAGGVL